MALSDSLEFTLGETNQALHPAGSMELSLESRNQARISLGLAAEWDWLKYPTGRKPAYIKNLSETGALLCATEELSIGEPIRMVLKHQQDALWITCAGTVVRRENKIESWPGNDLTLFRYGLRLTQPIQPGLLRSLRESCTLCEFCKEKPATNSSAGSSIHDCCALCHLRLACQNLLIQQRG